MHWVCGCLLAPFPGKWRSLWPARGLITALLLLGNSSTKVQPYCVCVCVCVCALRTSTSLPGCHLFHSSATAMPTVEQGVLRLARIVKASKEMSVVRKSIKELTEVLTLITCSDHMLAICVTESMNSHFSSCLGANSPAKCRLAWNCKCWRAAFQCECVATHVSVPSLSLPPCPPNLLHPPHHDSH